LYRRRRTLLAEIQAPTTTTHAPSCLDRVGPSNRIILGLAAGVALGLFLGEKGVLPRP
jgi:hypothetical protein